MTTDAEPAPMLSVLAPDHHDTHADIEEHTRTYLDHVQDRPDRSDGGVWRMRGRRVVRAWLPVGGVLLLAVVMRFWQLDKVGFNSDEAVYSGTAASLAGNDVLRTMFPIFRAHPLLLQILLSFGMHGQVSDWTARATSAVIGVATVGVTCGLGRRLYGTRVGLIAGVLLAVMPYHVIVTRQVLLDGLMTLLATCVVYCVVRYVESGAVAWMLAACAVMGAAVLSKETSIVLVGGLYAFFALTPAVRLRVRHIALGLGTMVLVIIAFPLALSLSGRASSGQHYLLWQLFRRPNHDTWFYLRTLPSALGWATLGLALVGVIWLRRENTWRERLLLSWMAVPAVFFTLWPVKGYQYLLPLAPVLAIMAGRTIAALAGVAALRRRRLGEAAMLAVGLIVTVSLFIPTWARINPSTNGTYLAGTGGLPGGREAGHWLLRNVPADAQLLAAGPSIANVLEFYGQRRVYALSVSPDPANRNPAYVPVPNPDLALREGTFQYLVWDSYTAGRSPSFGAKIATLVNRYHGVAVYTSTIAVASRAHTAETPVIVIYRVRTS